MTAQTGPDDAAISFDQMTERLSAGDPAAALALAERKVEAVAQRSGDGSGAHCQALFEMACVCLQSGLVQRAIGILKKATERVPANEEEERARLTYLLNLGDALASSGHLDEALAVHAQALEGRARVYSEDHPGYGFGLDSWADVAIGLGKFKEARERAQKALEIYRKHGHPRAGRAAALLLLANAGAGAPPSPIDSDEAADLMRNIRDRFVPVVARVECTALERLTAFVRDLQVASQAWSRLWARARRQKDNETQLKALEHLQRLAEMRDDPIQALDIELGLGLHFSESGDRDQATVHYDQSEQRGRDIGQPAPLAKALRNAGLFHLEGGDAERGLALLTEAASLGPEAGAEGARSALALGIQLQHRGRLDDARKALESGLSAIDPGDPDAISGRSHLGALENGQTCGCGDIQGETTAQLERLIRERLPPGVDVTIHFGEQGVEIHSDSELDEKTSREIANAVELAQIEMRRRLNM